MIEQQYIWKCDYPGCETKQFAQVWSYQEGRPTGLGPLEGWVVMVKDGEKKHYCSECADKIGEDA